MMYSILLTITLKFVSLNLARPHRLDRNDYGG